MEFPKWGWAPKNLFSKGFLPMAGLSFCRSLPLPPSLALENSALESPCERGLRPDPGHCGGARHPLRQPRPGRDSWMGLWKDLGRMAAQGWRAILKKVGFLEDP